MVEEAVLNTFGIDVTNDEVIPFGTGLINHTWLVNTSRNKYILQKINDAVFKQPDVIAHNIRVVGTYLKQHNPEYLFVTPVISSGGDDLIFKQGLGYYRMFPFVKDSVSKDVLESASQAYEAAKQFGRLTQLLNGLNINTVKITIPHFHDLFFRYKQFEQALQNTTLSCKKTARELIPYVIDQVGIVNTYNDILQNSEFKLRVTHHDTKISNVLFDKNGKGLCVIDLDTLMPGYFISDFGDMVRTYLSPVSEEETNFDKITIRKDFYKAIVDGYYGEMKNVLTDTEREYFFYAGKFIVYMQALRFLTDFLNNDIYYTPRYPLHNFVRAGNQITLLKRFMDCEDSLGKYPLD